MAGRNDHKEGAGGVLRLVAGVDPTGLRLTAQEGFLLSRIDGQTRWELLLDMAGMDTENAQRCLDDWLATGIVEWRSLPDTGAVQSAPSSTESGCAGGEGSWVDSGSPSFAELEQRIREVEPRLAGSYHEQLGLELGADERAIKKAYFELSRQFHPDRFFRCDLGPYAERVSLIFKTIQQAYKALTGPAGRDAEVDDSRFHSDKVSDADAFLYNKLQRLSRRELHSLPRSVLEERRQKAREFIHAARIAEREGRIPEAQDSVRMAIRFEPGNVQYRMELSKLQARADLVGSTRPSGSPRRDGGSGEGPSRG